MTVLRTGSSRVIWDPEMSLRPYLVHRSNLSTLRRKRVFKCKRIKL